MLLDAETGSADAQVVLEERGHVLVVARPGRYRVVARFLWPVAPPDEAGGQALCLDLPAALSNRVSLTLPGSGHEVTSPAAAALRVEDVQGATRAEVVVPHGEALRLAWTPRARRPDLETSRFYASVAGVARCDTGRVEVLTDIDLEIAQGQLGQLRLTYAPGESVTAVEGKGIGAWRFNPLTRGLEVKLSTPAVGAYRLRVRSQRAIAALPGTVTVTCPVVHDAGHQRSVLGVIGSARVVVDTVGAVGSANAVNVDDFSRDAAETLADLRGRGDSPVRAAGRLDTDGAGIDLAVRAVTPELRSTETATFSVSDERLVYNAKWVLNVSRAGVFEATLEVPDGYDIDALSAPQISHYDVVHDQRGRRAVVHFGTRTLGAVELRIALSRPIEALPAVLSVPRVLLHGTAKHRGQLVIAAEQGVRLNVTTKHGATEMDTAELGLRDPTARAFRLLRPTWSLKLASEVMAPALEVEVLHVARVHDASVRHTQTLRCRVQHAGFKELLLEIPPGATGVAVTGPEIAHAGPVEDEPGLYRVELKRKHFGRPYPLTVRYETTETDALRGIVVRGADRQHGYLAVTAGPRVELSAGPVGTQLQPIEGRSVPPRFGAGDLSGAALCYRATTAGYRLPLAAVHHQSAGLLDATVTRTDITSVITERGEALTRVDLDLNVGGRRRLEARLPAGASVWSLLVDGRATVPATRPESTGPVLVIPLPADAADDLPVEVSLTYRVPASGVFDWQSARFEGPRFDLPLHQINWTVYAPDDFVYHDVGGTLTLADDAQERVTFDQQAYEAEVQRFNDLRLRRAAAFQAAGNTLAEQGRQRAARQAFESAWYYSLSDAALNEDARVQLHRLAQDQALVGLIESRDQLRALDAPGVSPAVATTEDVTADRAQRLRNGLGREDADNLAAIIHRVVEAQSAAAATTVPLAVQMPRRGRVLRLSRSILVSPNEPMHLSLTPRRPVTAGPMTGWGIGLGVFSVLWLGGWLVTRQRVPSVGEVRAA